MKKLLLVPVILSLAACGGESTDTTNDQPTPLPVPEVMPTGLWEGTVNYSNGTSSEAYALIAPDGEARFIADGEQAKLQITQEGGKFTATIKSFGTMSDTGTASGELSKNTFTGEANFNGSVTSNFSFEKSPYSSDGASLDIIKGNYTNTNFSSSIAIDADGLISGSDTLGCQYNGNISVPDSSVNVYKVTFTVSSCGDYNGETSGLATYVQLYSDSTQKGLIYQVDNGVFSFTQVLI